LRVEPLVVAVALGFGVVAIVVHLGFRRVAEAVSGAHEGLNRSPRPTAPTPESAVMVRDREIRINERAQDALGQQHARYMEACWHPKPPAPGSPPDLGGAFAVTLTFDAEGHETRREINPGGGPANAAMLACVRAQSVPRLGIPAPGVGATTTVGLFLP
jgi:hypothetical protein